MVLLGARGTKTDPRAVPHAQVALVLGARPHTATAGRRGCSRTASAPRPRSTATGRVDRILASGDHGRPGYDEPNAMRRELVRLGVPDADVFTDHAGFATLDSVVRAKKVFDVRSAIVVTQGFHLSRALWLARRAGLTAYGLEAGAGHGYGRNGTKAKVREVLARTKAVGDVVTGAEPKFLGPRGRHRRQRAPPAAAEPLGDRRRRASFDILRDVARALPARCRRRGRDPRRLRTATETAPSTAATPAATTTPRDGRPRRRRPRRAAAAARGVRLVKVGAFDQPLYVTAPPRRPAADLRRRAGRADHGRARRHASSPTPFLDIRCQVTAGGEQGLLGLAFAPDYAQSGLFYVYYTGKDSKRAPGRVPAPDRRRADPGSARTVCVHDDPEPNHNGGQLVFGPDGYLYVGTGDGGGGNDQHGARGNAQNLGSPLGKILRIDPAPTAASRTRSRRQQPVRQPRRRARRDLRLRPAQPVALLLRPRQRRPRHRRRRPGRGRGDRLRPQGHRARRQLRLAPVGGPAAQLRRAGAGRGVPRDHPDPRRRLVLDHRRLRRARPRPSRACTAATSTATTARASCAARASAGGRAAGDRALAGCRRSSGLARSARTRAGRVYVVSQTAPVYRFAAR